MIIRRILFAGLAAAALAACGKKPGGDAAASRAESPSPIEAPFTLQGASPVEADAIFALLSERLRPTYESARFDERLGATVVTGLAFGGANSTTKDRLLVERAEFYGVDLDAIERVKDAAAAIDAPFERLFQKVRLFGVTMASEEMGPRDAEVSVGAVEIDQFRVRQGGFVKIERLADASDEARATNPMARFLNAFELQGLYFKDLVVAGGGGESGKVAVNAPDLRFVGVGGGRLAAVIANDADYEIAQSPIGRMAMLQSMGPQGAFLLGGPLGSFLAPEASRVTIGSFAWRDIDVSGWLEHALTGEEPPVTARNLIDLGTMKVLDTTTYVNGRKASTVEETTVSAAEFTWLFPSKVRAETKGATYDFTAYVAPEEEAAIDVIKGHGLDAVKAAGDVAWDWDAARGGAALRSTFETEGLADVDFGFEFSDLTLDGIKAASDQGSPNAVAEVGALKSFDLKIVDEKLLAALFDLAGLQAGQSGADLRASAPAMIRLSGAQAAMMSPRIAGYVDAIADFVAEGGTLQIVARPPAPAPFKDLAGAGRGDPAAAPEAINLTVTHTK